MTWQIAHDFIVGMKIICAFFGGLGVHACLAMVNKYTSEMAVSTAQT
jgi:hypothetical protein